MTRSRPERQSLEHIDRLAVVNFMERHSLECKVGLFLGENKTQEMFLSNSNFVRNKHILCILNLYLARQPIRAIRICTHMLIIVFFTYKIRTYFT